MRATRSRAYSPPNRGRKIMTEVEAENTFFRQQMSLMNEKMSRLKDAQASIPRMLHEMFHMNTSGGGIPPVVAPSPPPTSEQPIQDSPQTHHPSNQGSTYPVTPNTNSPGVQSKPQN